MHPNFVAYNPESMLRLRDIAPKTIGCNFDPSHMIWQQVDSVAGDPRAGRLDLSRPRERLPRRPRRTRRVNGVLDAKNYTQGARAVLDLQDRRLRQRRDLLEGPGQRPAHGRLRSRDQHRARRQPDVGAEGLKKGGRVPQATGDRRAGWRGVLGLNASAKMIRITAAPAAGTIQICRQSCAVSLIR